MPPTVPLNYSTPAIADRRWFGIAAIVVLIHWFLIVGWGLAFNDQGGYLYCRVVMPSNRDLLSTPWLFTVGGIVAVWLISRLDRALFSISQRRSLYPVVAFIFTQLFLFWLDRMSTLD